VPVVNESGWLKGHPKTESGYECVNLKVFTNISGEKIKLGARNCSHKFIYMCEVNLYFKKLLGKNLLNFKQGTTPPPLLKSLCADKPCVKNVTENRHLYNQ
jgi:hypothetical protein